MRKHLLPLLLLLGFCQLALAQAPLPLDAERRVSLAGHLSLLTDAERRLTAEQVAMSTAWQPLPGQLRRGFSEAALWLRVELDVSAATAGNWVLEAAPATLEYVDLYQQDAAGHWQVSRSGRQLPASQWPLASRNPAFSVTLSPGSHTLLLRLAGRPSLSAEFYLWPHAQFEANEVENALMFGLYFGMFVLLLFLQLLLWMRAREPLSRLYFIYGGVLLVYALLTFGHIQRWLDLPASLAVPALGLALALSPGILAHISSALLDLGHFFPRLERFYRLGFSAITLCGLALVLAGQYQWGMLLVQPAIILQALITAPLAILGACRGHAGARMYLAAFSVLEASAMLRFLRNLSWIEPSFLTEYSFLIGTLLHMLLLVLFVAYGFDRLKRELGVEQHARQEQRDFIAMVSHEFRTPLAIISTSVQQLAANPDAPAERTQTLCQNIRNATRRMSSLMDDYLSLDRLENAQQPLQLRLCDPLELLEDAAADWPDGRVRLQTRNLPAEWRCDPHLLLIALRNLLANANRHSPEDRPITLRATLSERECLCIEVTDRGEGIAEQELPRLFDKYFRGRSAAGKPGAGLGLFIVRHIVEMHQGRIQVRNQSAGGASFTLELPRL